MSDGYWERRLEEREKEKKLKGGDKDGRSNTKECD